MCRSRAAVALAASTGEETESTPPPDGGANPNRLHLDDVLLWREEIQNVLSQRYGNNKLLSGIQNSDRVRKLNQSLRGKWDGDYVMLQLLNKAVDVIREVDGRWLWYRDFNFYFTVVVPSRSALLNHRVLRSMVLLVLFYLGSAVLFCNVLQNDGICVVDTAGSMDDDNSGEPRPINNDGGWFVATDGWLSAIYFASVTMSTVGYGDLSVANASETPSDGSYLIGALYQVVSQRSETSLSF